MSNGCPLSFSFETALRKVPFESDPPNITWCHLSECVPWVTSQNQRMGNWFHYYYYCYLTVWFRDWSIMFNYLLGRIQTHSELRKVSVLLKVAALLLPEIFTLKNCLKFWIRLKDSSANSLRLRRSQAKGMSSKQTGIWGILKKTVGNWFVSLFPGLNGSEGAW